MQACSQQQSKEGAPQVIIKSKALDGFVTTGRKQLEKVCLTLVDLLTVSNFAHTFSLIFFTHTLSVTRLSLSPLPVSQANRNCLVMASTHDIQELDVSSILATQILTWIDDDDAVAEAKRYEGNLCVFVGACCTY